MPADDRPTLGSDVLDAAYVVGLIGPNLRPDRRQDLLEGRAVDRARRNLDATPADPVARPAGAATCATATGRLNESHQYEVAQPRFIAQSLDTQRYSKGRKGQLTPAMHGGALIETNSQEGSHDGSQHRSDGRIRRCRDCRNRLCVFALLIVRVVNASGGVVGWRCWARWRCRVTSEPHRTPSIEPRSPASVPRFCGLVVVSWQRCGLTPRRPTSSCSNRLLVVSHHHPSRVWAQDPSPTRTRLSFE